MTGNKSLLSDYVEEDGPVVMIGDNQEKVKGYGKIYGRDGVELKVAYIEGFSFNLISVAQLCNKGYEIEINQKKVLVTKKESTKKKKIWVKKGSYPPTVKMNEEKKKDQS